MLMQWLRSFQELNPSCALHDASCTAVSCKHVAGLLRLARLPFAAGHEVFLVGGAVRDMLLHLEPKDYDLLTSAHLKQVKALYPASHLIGRNFPICVVNSQGARVEVSSMHTLSAATTGNSKTTQNAAVPADVAAHLLGTMHEQQGRHIVQLPHGAPSWAAAKRANALSRDFTVNGLLYDPFQRVLYDYIDGVADINSRQLRCIGDPGIRFQKDPACLLRAVRCAARAGLSIEPSTACALQQHSHLVTSLNAQRLTAELIALLGHGAAAASLAMLQKMQLLQRLLPLHDEQLVHQHVRHEQQHVDWVPGSHDSSTTTSSHSTAPGNSLSAVTANSELGQLLGNLGTRPDNYDSQHRQHPKLAAVGSSGKAFQQHRQALILQVLGALDKHVVWARQCNRRQQQQGIEPEVLLACLTAPLLRKQIQQAVTQLQQLVLVRKEQAEGAHLTRKPQQQHQHQQPDSAQAGQAHAAATLEGLFMQQQQCQHARHSDTCLHLHHSSAALSRHRRSMAAARAFSSQDGRLCHDLQLHSAAAQLLEGCSAEHVLHKQALIVATQVCSGPLQPFSTAQLFGVKAPELAAGLLMSHIELCKQGKQRVEQAWQQQQCHWQCQTQTINQQQQQHLQNSTIAAPTFHNYSVTSGHSSVSSSSYEHQNKVEFDIVMPRTNKQYRKWLQQQRTPEVQAGSISSNGSMQDLFLAAVAATSEEGDSIGNKWKTAQGAGRQWQQQWQPVAMQLSKQQYAVHQVLSSAGAGLHDLHQTLTRLQRALPS
eukprot:GHRR01019674.1.p1 GENE.GHRR01019674.1~~GHRR01019674.1.p1  ORF type:complete len:768 (+),score=291.76 GHRR01019674.1:163-2466(+)